MCIADIITNNFHNMTSLLGGIVIIHENIKFSQIAYCKLYVVSYTCKYLTH